MKTLSALFLVASLVGIASTAGCDRRPCLQSHAEETTVIEQIMIGITNGMPQYIYMPQEETVTVCDKYGPEPK